MEYKLFTLPAVFVQDEIEELNKFLRGHKIIEIEKHLINQNGTAYWSFCVTYLIENSTNTNFQRRAEKVDYKNVLNDGAFRLFLKLRLIRRAIAEKDAVPAYAVFTDAELAEISKLSEISEHSMRSIHGIGAKKVEKYGTVICKMLLDNDIVFDNSDTNGSL